MLGISDALYHNVEHRGWYASGPNILRGRHLHNHMTAEDSAHVIICLPNPRQWLVRGLFKDDDSDGFVIDSTHK